MKKTIFAIAVLALVSCGGSSESTPVVDSTVVVDSVAVDTSSAESTGGIQAGGRQDGSEIK